MKRFLLQNDDKTIEGVQFSDGFIVLHGGVFQGCHVESLDELARISPHAKPQWLDDEREWTQEELDYLAQRWEVAVIQHDDATPALITTVDAMIQLRKWGLLEEGKA